MRHGQLWVVVELFSTWIVVHRSSENKMSGAGRPLIRLSDFRVITRSSVWPSSCVGSAACWVKDIDSNKSKKWQAAGSLWSSTWMLKSPVRQMSSLDSITDSSYSENSSVKLFTVTGWLIEYGGQKIQKKCVNHIQACKHSCYPWTKGPYHRLYDQFYDSGTVCSQVELSRSKRGSQ